MSLNETQWQLIIEKALVNKTYHEAVRLVLVEEWSTKEASDLEGVDQSYMYQQLDKVKALAEWSHRLIDAGAAWKK